MLQICWLGVCLIILMIQAVTEAEQEVYRGGGPVRDPIGPKDGSENSSNASGSELPRKSVKSRVAPNRAMFPYWLMKKTRHTSQRCNVKIIPTDKKNRISHRPLKNVKSRRHHLTLPSQLQLISRKKRIPYQQQFRPKYKTASISSLL